MVLPAPHVFFERVRVEVASTGGRAQVRGSSSWAALWWERPHRSALAMASSIVVPFPKARK